MIGFFGSGLEKIGNGIGYIFWEQLAWPKISVETPIVKWLGTRILLYILLGGAHQLRFLMDGFDGDLTDCNRIVRTATDRYFSI